MSFSEKIEELKKMQVLESQIKASAITRGNKYELTMLSIITKKIENLQKDINECLNGKNNEITEEERALSLSLVNMN